MENEVTIEGVRYLVLTRKPYEYKGKQRVSLGLKRPKGRKAYIAILYENGTFSSAVCVG